MSERHNQNAVSDEEIIAALLTHGTIAAAAETVNMAPRTIYNRMGTRAFKAAYSAARADVLRAAVVQMQRNLSAAVETVSGIMQDPQNTAGTRLAAAKMILDNAAKYAERLSSADTDTGTYSHPAMCSDPDLW